MHRSYCDYCGEEDSGAILCNCRQGIYDYFIRLTGHLIYRAKVGSWHEGAFGELILWPLLLFLILMAILAWI